MPEQITVRDIERPEVRELMRESNLIIGHDLATGNEPIFFGLGMLEDIIHGHQHEYGPQLVLSVSYDSRTDELEYLYVAVQVLRGHCDYDASTRVDD